MLSVLVRVILALRLYRGWELPLLRKQRETLVRSYRESLPLSMFRPYRLGPCAAALVTVVSNPFCRQRSVLRLGVVVSFLHQQ